MTFNPILIWFIAGLALILSEFMIPGVILVFFGAGAWLAAVTTALGWTPGWTSQLLTFGVSSLVLLLVLRRWFRSRFFGYVGDDNNLESNIDGLAGQIVTVLAAIDAGHDDGRVEFKGASWKATSDKPIPAGQRAVILSADGISLKVRPE